MMKKIWQCLKKIIISVFILYGYNLIATRFNLVIPINIFTVGSISLLCVDLSLRKYAYHSPITDCWGILPVESREYQYLAYASTSLLNCA